MAWTLPHPHSSDVQGPQTCSTTTHEYVVLYTLANECVVGRRPLGSGAFTTHQFTGAARTELGIDGSAITDGHRYPMIQVAQHNGVDSSADVLFVFANMHDHNVRAVTNEASPGSITSWAAFTLPSEQSNNTYPHIRRVTVPGFSGLYLMWRCGPQNEGGVAAADNRSGAGDSRHWRRPDGGAWTYLGVIFKGYNIDLDGPGPGTDLGHPLGWETDQNYSFYPSGVEVEPADSIHPGRLHIAGTWRQGVAQPSRTMVDAVTVAGDPTVTSATGAFDAGDLFMEAVGPWIDGGGPRFVGAVNSSTSIELSSSPSSNVPANPTGSQTATRLTISRHREGFNATNGTPAVTVNVPGNLSAKDLHAPVAGSFLPRVAYIGEITNPTLFQLSSSPTSHVPLNATGNTSPVGNIIIGQAIERNNIRPSYMYSDDAGSTWRALDGTAVTLPHEPFTNPAVLVGFDGDSEGFINGGGLTINRATGEPHFVTSRGPYHHIWPNGAGGWQRQILGSLSGGYTPVAGKGHLISWIIPYFIADELWWLSVNSEPSGDRRCRLTKADGSFSVPLGGPVPAEWDTNADPDLYSRSGIVQVCVPDGDTPRTWRYPTGCFAHVA